MDFFKEKYGYLPIYRTTSNPAKRNNLENNKAARRKPNNKAV